MNLVIRSDHYHDHYCSYTPTIAIITIITIVDFMLIHNEIWPGDLSSVEKHMATDYNHVHDIAVVVRLCSQPHLHGFYVPNLWIFDCQGHVQCQFS